MQPVASRKCYHPISEPIETLRSSWWCALFDQSEHAQVICSKDGTIIEENRKSAFLIGRELANNPSSRRFDSVLSSQARLRFHAIISGSKNRNATLSSVSLSVDSNLPFIADLFFQALGDEYWLITIKDAGKRLRMETHSHRLTTAIDSIPDAVYLTDASLCLTFVNLAYQSQSGHDLEDILGQDFQCFCISKSLLPKQRCLDLLMKGESWCGELENSRANGSSYFV